MLKLEKFLWTLCGGGLMTSASSYFTPELFEFYSGWGLVVFLVMFTAMCLLSCRDYIRYKKSKTRKNLINIIEKINSDLLSWRAWGDIKSDYASNMLIFSRSIDAVSVDNIDLFNKLDESYKKLSEMKKQQGNVMSNNRPRPYDIERYKPTVLKLSSALVETL